MQEGKRQTVHGYSLKKGRQPVMKQQQGTFDDEEKCGESRSSEAPNPKPLPSALRHYSSLQECPRSEYIFVVILGLCCAYTAGYSNGVALSGYLSVGDTLGARQPVAGVTNEYTVSAIAAGEADAEEYMFAIGTIFSHMAGSVISSVMNPRPVSFVLSPRYGPTFVIGAIFSSFGAVAAIFNQRREFYLTTIGNGILNGVTSMYSANLIRTTSYSGPTTDIGIYVGQVLRGNRTNLWRLYILSGLTFAFWLGGLSGYEASKFKREYSLIFNAVFFATIGFSIIVYFVIAHKVSFCDAFFGIGKFGIKLEKVTVKRRRTDSGKITNGQSGDAAFNPGTSSLDEEELMRIFDELDSNEQEAVDQDRLMELLASKDLVVKKHRRSIFGIINARMAANEHDQTGDWTISRDDWRRLVKQNSSRRGFSTLSSNDNGNSASVRSSLNALRDASIRQLEGSGLHVIEEDEAEGGTVGNGR